jgi:hypothetical protein
MNAKESSIVIEATEKIEPNQLMAPTWLVLVPVLIIALVVLKKFIYITDEKRDDM